MMVILVVLFTQKDKVICKLDTQIFGPFAWWRGRRDTDSRIDTLYKLHGILEKDVLALENKLKRKKKEVK